MRVIPGAVLLWLLAVAAGFAVLTKFAATAGDAGNAPECWPAGSELVPDRARDTLVLFLHPRCPCSRATVEELDRLLASCQGQLAVHVLFVRPAGMPTGWEQTDLWRRAAAIPGVQVHADAAAAAARRFGARTSGQALLYAPGGRRLFRGGITAARGHAGDNAGRDAIRALVTEGGPGGKENPVFGCPLFD